MEYSFVFKPLEMQDDFLVLPQNKGAIMLSFPALVIPALHSAAEMLENVR